MWNCKDDWIDPLTCWTPTLWDDLLGYDSVYNRNSKAINKQLKENGIIAEDRGNHTVFGVTYYVIRIWDRTEQPCGEYVDEKGIANALGIPRDWVAFASIYTKESCSHRVYWIKYDELNTKYCNEKGELVFEFNFDSLKKENCYTTHNKVKKQLNEYGIYVENLEIVFGKYYAIEVRDNGAVHTDITKALHISSDRIHVSIPYKLYMIDLEE